ncbi:MAG: ABC transporter substrate-binding protein [Gaiellaceae bacterium]
MHRRITLSIAMAAVGAGLLMASSFAGSASASAPQRAGSADAKRGGTLRLNVSSTDFEFTDPAMAYDAIGWQMLYAVNITLLNYPDKPAPEGTRLVPEAATGFPRVSADGKTYTFTVRSGLKFSDGSAVTAAAFKRAIERAADPQQASPAIAFLHDVVGADERNAGKARSVSGVTAKGQTLTIRLRQANPTLLAELAMPFFGAVKPSMAIDPKGISVYPSAGPYRIVSRSITQSLTLARNPHYKGTRPANADRIVYTVNTDQNQSLLQVRAGQADYDASGLPPTAHADLAQQFGVRKGGEGRYFVNPYMGVGYVALNTSRAPFSRVNIRKAANFAIDRPAMVRVSGKFYGKRSDQILPPSLQGFREAAIYPIKGADPARAKQLSGGASNTVTIIHSTTALRTAQAQVLKFNLEQMGLKVEAKPLPFAVALRTVGTRGADFDAYVGGWVADYPDPFDFINVLLDGGNIQAANNSNYSYFNDAKFNKQMSDFAKLSGPQRYSAYGQLDVEIMRNAAPWAPFANPNSRELVSARITNYIHHPVYAGAVVNALAIK